MPLDGMNQIQRNLHAITEQMQQHAAAAADESAIHLENYAKQTAPFKDRSSNLRNSISHDSSRIPDGYRMVVFASMTYAPYVELGTRHSRPYAFLWPAVAENQHVIMDIFKRHLQL